MKIAWLTDAHGIFVDRHAWELALNITREFKPDVVPVGSDDTDFYTLSKFDKNPERRFTLQDELDFQWQRSMELKDAVDPHWNSAEKPDGHTPVFHPTVFGNHNHRLMKQLWNKPTFFGLRAMEYQNLMGYDVFGFSWAGNPWDALANLEWSPMPGLVFTHGEKVSQYPGYSVKNQMASRFYDASLVMGHCHRGAATVVSKPDGTQLWGIEGFCLCDLHPEYAKNTNWTQGIVFVTAHEDRVPQFELIPFHRSSDAVYAYWRDSEYTVSLSKPY